MGGAGDGSDLTTMTAGVDSSGSCSRRAYTRLVRDFGGNALGLSQIILPIPVMARTYKTLENIVFMEQALTQSTVHKVLSNSSSDGSGGSSAA